MNRKHTLIRNGIARARDRIRLGVVHLTSMLSHTIYGRCRTSANPFQWKWARLDSMAGRRTDCWIYCGFILWASAIAGNLCDSHLLCASLRIGNRDSSFEYVYIWSSLSIYVDNSSRQHALEASPMSRDARHSSYNYFVNNLSVVHELITFLGGNTLSFNASLGTHTHLQRMRPDSTFRQLRPPGYATMIGVKMRAIHITRLTINFNGDGSK